MSQLDTPTKCRRCGGTGFVNFSNIEGGRCYACTGVDTSYTAAIATAAAAMTDQDRAERWAQICDERKAARRARRAGL